MAQDSRIELIFGEPAGRGVASAARGLFGLDRKSQPAVAVLPQSLWPPLVVFLPPLAQLDDLGARLDHIATLIVERHRVGCQFDLRTVRAELVMVPL
jgi:hypothetical protein